MNKFFDSIRMVLLLSILPIVFQFGTSLLVNDHISTLLFKSKKSLSSISQDKAIDENYLTFVSPNCDRCTAYNLVKLTPSGNGILRSVANTSELNSALSLAQPGDVIELEDGIYYNGVGKRIDGLHGTIANSITIQAKNHLGAKWYGSSYSLHLKEASYLNILGIDFSNATIWTVVNGAGNAGSSPGGQNYIGKVNDIFYSHNEFRGGTTEATFVIRGYGNIPSYNVTVSCNKIYDNLGGNHSEGIYIGQGSGQIDVSHDILIENNDIFNLDDEAIDVKRGTTNITLRGNHIYDINTRTSGAVVLGLNDVNYPNGNYLVENNRIWNITDQTPFSDANGISIAHGDATIKNNIIWNVLNSAIVSHSTRSTSNIGYGNLSANDLYVYNNTFYNCGGDCLKETSSPGSGFPADFDVQNNVSSNTSSVLGTTSNYIASSTDFIGPIIGSADAGEGPGSGFQLSGSSAAIDQGNNLPQVNVDIIGVSRPQNGLWDPGAFERISCTIGAVCNDQDNQTENDTYDENCNCVGILIGNEIDCVPNQNIIIDGSNSEWQNISFQIEMDVWDNVSSLADLSGSFQISWDDTHLYFFVEVTDDVLINDSTSSWLDDGVEIYIDGGNEKNTTYDVNDHQLRFAYNDPNIYVLTGPDNPPGVSFSQLITSSGYKMEIKIPFTFIGSNLMSGDLIGIDVHINDDDDGGDRDSKLNWVDKTDQAWNNPSLFGTMQLADCRMGQIGNYVWEDINNNGIQDPSENGMSGVVINLYDDLGVFISATSSNADGLYVFENLDAGSYYLEFIHPNTSFNFTLPNQGVDDAVDSNVDGSNGPGTTPVINLSMDEMNINWDAGFQQVALPLVWSEVEISTYKNYHLLSWTTTNEVNTLHFDIERSINNQGFTSIGILQSNNNSATNLYDIRDFDIDISGMYTYRIKQVDQDGTFQYSKIVLTRRGQEQDIAIYPNPNKGYINITIYSTELDPSSIVISDISGQRYSVMPFIVQDRVDASHLELDIRSLPNGLYFVEINFGGILSKHKILKVD